MRRVNLSEPDLELDDADPPGFQALMHRFGPSLGASRTGASLYELPPGEALCPYHFEYGEDEWVLVLSGSPTLRDPDGTHELRALDVVFFPPGPDGAHQLRNDSAEPARILMWSTIVYPGATVYPDSDKIGIWPDETKRDHILVERSSGVDYFHGEI